MENTYLDFAENDYNFVRQSIDLGLTGNAIASLSQNICEKYMKHIISQFVPSTQEESMEKQQVLKTHSLSRLLQFMHRKQDIYYSEDAENHMRMIDGFYFSTRYPGADSFMVDSRDIERCQIAIDECRDETLEILGQMFPVQNHSAQDENLDEEDLEL